MKGLDYIKESGVEQGCLGQDIVDTIHHRVTEIHS